MTSTDIRMGPWRPLYEYLAQRPDETDIDITYDDVEAIVHLPLPTTGRSRSEWWTVIPLKQRARSWLAAGRHPFASDTGVVFRRTAHLAGHSLERQRRSRSMMDDYATSALVVPPTSEAVDRGWWEPHIVYVIHFPEAEVIKVGLTHGDSNRATVLSGPGGTVLQVNRLANRWSATVLEGAFLRLADGFRVEPPLWLARRPESLSSGRIPLPPPLLTKLLRWLEKLRNSRTGLCPFPAPIVVMNVQTHGALLLGHRTNRRDAHDQCLCEGRP